MIRNRYLRWLAPIAGVLVTLALSAAPAGATVVCPPGISPPSQYCHNVKPTAVTGSATNINETSATLNGAAGAGVRGGDPTQWFFEFGTSTNYGSQTPAQTLGACPSGVIPPSPSCTTPAHQGVTANLSGLTPCTTYHFQLVATNRDGTTFGGDKTVEPGFTKPFTNFKTPNKVKHNKRFTVQYTLSYNATSVKIFIKRKNGSILKTYSLGAQQAGKHSKKIKAPKKKGNYTLELHVKLSCGSQSEKHKLKVH